MKKGEVWFVALPEGKGHEQKGQRPGLVIASSEGITLTIPLTSNADRYQLTYTEIIEQTPENKLSCDSIALIFQLSAVDNSRFIRQMGSITSEKQKVIDDHLKSMLKIQ